MLGVDGESLAHAAGWDSAGSEAKVHAETRRRGEELRSNGGRPLCLGFSVVTILVTRRVEIKSTARYAEG